MVDLLNSGLRSSIYWFYSVLCGMFFHIGFATIPSGGGGTLFGGLLVKQLNLQCKGILRLCLVTTGTVLVLTLTLLARCENVPFAGINVNYIHTNRSVRMHLFIFVLFNQVVEAVGWARQRAEACENQSKRFCFGDLV